MRFFFFFLAIVISLSINNKISAQSVQDSTAIKTAALNYIEGYFYKDAKRMKDALHPELIKRCIQQDENGKDFIINLSASYMVMRAANNTNRHANNPEGKMEAKVKIYDITGNSATVKITNNQYGFIDYAHMGKFGDGWKIVNVLWANLPK